MPSSFCLPMHSYLHVLLHLTASHIRQRWCLSMEGRAEAKLFSTAGGEGKTRATGDVWQEGALLNQEQHNNYTPCQGAELQAAPQLSSPELLCTKLKDCWV